MTRLVVTLGFLLAFAAGMVLGVRSRTQEPPPEPQPPRHGGWLAAELELSPDQRTQLDRIWSETAFRGRHGREERRREIFRARDEAIVGLIRPEDRPAYEEILRQHSEQMNALEREWKDAFQSAVEQTRELLTPEQRTRYEELLQRQQPERGRPDWRRPERGGDGERDRDRGRDRRRERSTETAPARPVS